MAAEQMSRTFPALTCADTKCRTGNPLAVKHCQHCAHILRERELYLRAYEERELYLASVGGGAMNADKPKPPVTYGCPFCGKPFAEIKAFAAHKDSCLNRGPRLTGDRAMRLAVEAGEQTAKNPALARQQALAWRKFIRHVWGGPAARPSDATKPSEQFSGEYDERMALGDETVRA
jgi:hypothetical protein